MGPQRPGHGPAGLRLSSSALRALELLGMRCGVGWQGGKFKGHLPTNFSTLSVVSITVPDKIFVQKKSILPPKKRNLKALI